jgi:hypothetical protein
MTTGEGIFWGAVVVGLIGLYVATKDRWKWQRIIKWVGVVLLVPVLGVAGYVGWSTWVESQPRVELALYGITIGDSMDDVMYKKGKPDREEKDCPKDKPDCVDAALWTYTKDDLTYIVSFEKSRVLWVAANANFGSRYALPSFRGMSNYWGQAEVEKLYGPPTNVSVNTHKTQRLVSFVKYGVFFTFEKDEVVGVGVMSPFGKGLAFTDEASPK